MFAEQRKSGFRKTPAPLKAPARSGKNSGAGAELEPILETASSRSWAGACIEKGSGAGAEPEPRFWKSLEPKQTQKAPYSSGKKI